MNYDNVKTKRILIDDLRYWNVKLEKEFVTKRYKYQAGDFMNMKYFIDNKEYDFKVQLAKVTTNKVVGLEDTYYDNGYLILNKAYYQELATFPYEVMLNSKNPEKLIKDLELLDFNLKITNLEKSVQSEKSMLIVISIFLYGFITVISLIGVTNIFNTITSNIELRKSEFAILKSIGMTKKEFNRMINLETLFYSSKSLIYGIILELIGSYLIHLSFNQTVERIYVFPIKAIIISIIFVLIIIYVIMKYSINKINKQNTIETIRNENI